MKITCSISSLQYTVPYFSLNTDRIPHPIFQCSQKTLLAQLRPFLNGHLQEPECILLFLALLNSTDAIEWRNPFKFTENAVELIRHNMEKTSIAVYKLNELITMGNKDFHIPKYVCSKHGEADTVFGLLRAVEAWENAITEFTSGRKAQEAGAKLLRIEQVLERLLRMQQRKPEAFAKKLADWAVVAADFPTYEIIRGHILWNCSAYWQDIIRRCILGANIISIPSDDLIDLIEYCEEEIPHGSIYAATLMTILRGAVKKQREFLGLPAHKGIRVFRVVPASHEEEAQHEKDILTLRSMSMNAPVNKPQRCDFGDAFMYLRTVARWEAAQTLAQMEQDSPGSTALAIASANEAPKDDGYASDY